MPQSKQCYLLNYRFDALLMIFSPKIVMLKKKSVSLTNYDHDTSGWHSHSVCSLSRNEPFFTIVYPRSLFLPPCPSSSLPPFHCSFLRSDPNFQEADYICFGLITPPTIALCFSQLLLRMVTDWISTSPDPYHIASSFLRISLKKKKWRCGVEKSNTWGWRQ